MKKFLKKITVLLLATLMVASAFSFVGCDNNGNEQKTVYSVSLDTTNKNITLMDEFYLNPTVVEVPNTVVTFASDNTKVVSVNSEGKVKGESIGSATITATYGTATATCTVNVALPEQKPSLSLQSVTDFSKQINVVSGQPFDLNAFVNYKGIAYDDAEISFSLVGEDCGSIQNNVFTPALPEGTTEKQAEIIITASWRGVSVADAPTLRETLKVKIVDVTAKDGSTYLLINNTLAYPQAITLYKADEVDGVAFGKSIDFAIRSINNGVLSQDASLTSVSYSTPDIVYVENDKLIALEKGTTEMTVELTNAGDNAIAEVVKVVIPVEVKYPVIEKNDAFVIGNVSAKDGYDLTEIQKIYADGAEHTITSAYQNYEQEGETALTVEGGKVTGFVADNKKVKSANVTLFTDSYGYTFDLNIYSDIITTEEELELALKLQKTTIKNAAGKDREIAYKDGAYLLNSNITLSEKWVQDVVINYKNATYTGIFTHGWESNDEGFAGYFDGNGYTITVPELGAKGFFGRVRDGAVIKNVAFKIEAMSLSANTQNVVFGIAIGHNYTFGGNDANALAQREIGKTYMSNIAVIVNSRTAIKEFDGLFGIINNAKWYDEIWREVRITDVYVRLGTNVTVKNETRTDDNYGIVASINHGNVLGNRDYIRDAVSNVVYISPEEKSLITVTTNDSFVYTAGTTSSPTKLFSFYTEADLGTELLTQSWFTTYNAGLVGKDDPSRTNANRFAVPGISRYDTFAFMKRDGITRVGSWVVGSNGNAVTYDGIRI